MEYEFRRPELEDQELISSYFAKAPGRSCERTFVNVYLWSRHYKVKFAVIEDALVFRDEGDGTRLSSAMRGMVLHFPIRQARMRQ